MNAPETPPRTLTRALRGLVTGVLALVILFEEWGWEPLQRAFAWVARLPLVHRVEGWIARLSPVPSLLVLFVPSATLLLPTKLAALWLLASGHALLGAAVVVLAKILGTAIVARLFALTRPALMRMPWFATAYTRWAAWKGALLARVRASWAWRWARVVKRAAQRSWKAWLQRRR